MNGDWAGGELVGGCTRACRALCDAFNRRDIATVVCVPLTSNLRWAGAPGNVALPVAITGLPRDSVAIVSQLLAIDKDLLTERAGRVPRSKFDLVIAGIDVLLGR